MNISKQKMLKKQGNILLSNNMKDNETRRNLLIRDKNFSQILETSSKMIYEASSELEDVMDEIRSSLLKNTDFILRIFNSIGNFFDKPIILADQRGNVQYYNNLAKDIFFPTLLDNINIFSLIFNKENPTRSEINHGMNVDKRIKIKTHDGNFLNIKVNYFSIISDNKIHYLILIDDYNSSKKEDGGRNEFNQINFLFRKIFSKNKNFAIFSWKVYKNDKNENNHENGITENNKNNKGEEKTKLVYFNDSFVYNFSYVMNSDFDLNLIFDLNKINNEELHEAKVKKFENIKRAVDIKTYYEGIADIKLVDHEFDYNLNDSIENIKIVSKPCQIYIAKLNEIKKPDSMKENIYLMVVDVGYEQNFMVQNKQNKKKIENCLINLVSGGVVGSWSYDIQTDVFSINHMDEIYNKNPLLLTIMNDLIKTLNNKEHDSNSLIEKISHTKEKFYEFIISKDGTSFDLKMELCIDCLFEELDKLAKKDREINVNLIKAKIESKIKINDENKQIMMKTIRFMKSNQKDEIVEGIFFIV